MLNHYNIYPYISSEYFSLDKIDITLDETLDNIDITIPVDYVCSTVSNFVKNIALNNRFYSLKLIIDLLGETELLHNTWSKTKHNSFVLMLLIGSSLPELLTSHETSPKSYRAFLTRYFNVRNDGKLVYDSNSSFCKQCHSYSDKSFDTVDTTKFVDSVDSVYSVDSVDSLDSNDTLEESNIKIEKMISHTLKDCSGSVKDCVRFNMRMFKKNMMLFCKLYGKVYAIGYILTYIKTKDIWKIIPMYIKDVFRSSFALSLMYLIIHMYLTVIDRMQIPKKIHYHFGLVISAIPLIMLEERNRLGAIFQFMTSIYANMFMYYSTPKNDTFWKLILYSVVIISLKYRGGNRTLLSLI